MTEKTSHRTTEEIILEEIQKLRNQIKNNEVSIEEVGEIRKKIQDLVNTLAWWNNE